MTSRAEERAPRESEARTPDTGASDQFSDGTTEPGRKDESGRAGSYPGTSASGLPDGVDVVIERRMERQSDAPEGAEPDTKAETTDAPVERREEHSSGRDSGDSWDWAEENIVPEGLRSER
jgi:hypothetical protein